MSVHSSLRVRRFERKIVGKSTPNQLRATARKRRLHEEKTKRLREEATQLGISVTELLSKKSRESEEQLKRIEEERRRAFKKYIEEQKSRYVRSYW